MNVILHALENVPPFRDYFLREENYAHITPPPGDQTFILGKTLVLPSIALPSSPLIHSDLSVQCKGWGSSFASFGTHATLKLMSVLMKCCKQWPPPARSVSKLQNRVNLNKAHLSHFKDLTVVIMKMLICACLGDPVDFLSWLLNTLHMALGGTKKQRSSEFALLKWSLCGGVDVCRCGA